MNTHTGTPWLLGMLLAATLSSLATAISFNDLPGDGETPIVNSHAGLNWDSICTRNESESIGNRYGFGTISTPFVVYNAYGNPGSFSSATPIIRRVRMALSHGSNGLLMTLTRLNGSTTLYSEVFTLSTTTPLLLESDWSGITEVILSKNLTSHMATDNLAINESTAPEPGTQFLRFCGFAGIALWADTELRPGN